MDHPLTLNSFPGENLVPEPADEAEEANERGFDPAGPDPDRGEHLPVVAEQHGLERVRGARSQVRLSPTPVTVKDPGLGLRSWLLGIWATRGNELILAEARRPACYTEPIKTKRRWIWSLGLALKRINFMIYEQILHESSCAIWYITSQFIF